jgi:hypothetical protein
MTRRYPHYIQTATKDYWPDAVLCVSVEATRVANGSGMDAGPLVFSGWNSELLETNFGNVRSLQSSGGVEQNELWHLIEKLCGEYHDLWILSSCASREWTLLGLWELIEAEEIHIADKDYRHAQPSKNQVRNLRHGMPNPLAPLSSSALSRLRQNAQGFIVLEDPPCIAKLKIDGATSHFTWVDTRNYGIGKPADCAYGPNETSWLSGLYSRMCGVNQRWRLGGIKLTAASQAIYGWRRSYKTHSVYCHVQPMGQRIEQAAYFGGRCEAYELGIARDNVYHVDFRSLYPFICTASALPVRLESVYQHTGGAGCGRELNPSCQIARVAIETDEPAYPYRRSVQKRDRTGVRERPLAVMDSNGDTDIIYPVGRFVTTLCGPELQDAVDRNRIKDVLEICEYQMEPALREYAIALYEARQWTEANQYPGLSEYVKKLLVCLPGKLGQVNHSWEYDPSAWCDLQWGEWHGKDKDGRTNRYRSIGGMVFRDTTCGFAYDSCPSVAAWITSAARIRLLQAIRISGWDNVYYVDTDGLIVSSVAYGRMLSKGMVQDRSLGYLRLLAGSAKCTIHGIKSYSIGRRFVNAGEQRGQCIDAGDGKHYWYTPVIAESLQGSVKPNIKPIYKRYRTPQEYRQGIVWSDGKVSPLVLREW